MAQGQQFTAIRPRRIITNENFFKKPDGGNWLVNPRITKEEKTKRPKLGSNPYQELPPEFQRAFGSNVDKRPSFKSAFASKTAFKVFDKAHPKSGFKAEFKDIDGDQVDDVVIYDKAGKIIAVNGVIIQEAKWRDLSPYYEQSARQKLSWDVGHGFKTEDGSSKVSGISKAWKDKFLKEVYNVILSNTEGSEDDIKTINAIRKAYPLAKIAKDFIKLLMIQEAEKAVSTSNEATSQEDYDARVESLMKTKKFKVYIGGLAMSAKIDDDYRIYLANLVRDYILNESGGGTDIAQAPVWRRNNIPVKEGGEDVFKVNYVPKPVIQVADPFIAKVQELYSQLESAEGDEVDPSMISIARSLHMPSVTSQTTNGEIMQWLQVAFGSQ